MFTKADICLPKNADLTKWSVVACDQYTSEPEYWESVDAIVGDAPSTLRLTLPEVYLEKEGEAEKIREIHAAMRAYLPDMVTYPDSFFYIERTLSGGRVRRGLIGAVDLECYEYEKGAEPLVRATEGTVLERIPPRMRVREAATLELPHVMLLADDREKRILEKINVENCEKLYDFELMKNGGHIVGYLLNAEEKIRVQAAIASLSDDFAARHPEKAPFILAVGDGNHSLATAKACYEKLKKEIGAEKAMAHPARYALAELVNLHDEALEFEPIHRVIFDTDAEALLAEFQVYCAQNGDSSLPKQTFHYFSAAGEGDVVIDKPLSPLEVGTLQRFLDTKGVKIDYIHGADVTKRLGEEEGNLGILLPKMDKNLLFDTVLADGALPRKTFSMGEAHEKRYYLESRRIR